MALKAAYIEYEWRRTYNQESTYNHLWMLYTWPKAKLLSIQKKMKKQTIIIIINLRKKNDELLLKSSKQNEITEKLWFWCVRSFQHSNNFQRNSWRRCLFDFQYELKNEKLWKKEKTNLRLVANWQHLGVPWRHPYTCLIFFLSKYSNSQKLTDWTIHYLYFLNGLFTVRQKLNSCFCLLCLRRDVCFVISIRCMNGCWFERCLCMHGAAFGTRHTLITTSDQEKYLCNKFALLNRKRKHFLFTNLYSVLVKPNAFYNHFIFGSMH